MVFLSRFFRVGRDWVIFMCGLPEMVERRMTATVTDMLRACGPSALIAPLMMVRTLIMTRVVPVP